MDDFPCLNNNYLINIDNKKFIYGRNDGKIFLIQIGTLKIIKIFEVDSKIQTINLLNNGLIIKRIIYMMEIKLILVKQVYLLLLFI